MMFFRMLWLSITVAFLLMIYSLFVSPKGLKEYMERKNLFTELSRKHQEVMIANQELYEKIKKFSKSAAFREQIVREKLGWTRPDERIIVITSEVDRAEKKKEGGRE